MSQMKTLILAIFALMAANQAAGLKLSVYYESLCPDSIRFITKQLYPTYKELEFDVEFVPYGKASHTDDPWAISCQHGPNECLGNSVQACALNRYQKPDDQVEFVNCVMSSSFPPGAGQECADELGLNYDGIAACSTGNEGHRLLGANGNVTHALKPSITFVPTIIFNDRYSDVTQNLALTNLPQAICSAEPTIEGCNNARRG